ncbi:hypothetical protein EVAR_18326_1 [Eumeta japonica]|uniref:Uncharacterized protein n=1 Tax=Eumeta variegata TaxID=151549 RepID=A0A4C1V8K4_EUMVA|nr:hypothetical protein EVAR_18326_1 [Eumeta japonica]
MAEKKIESRINDVMMRSVRSMCGVSLKDRGRNSDVRERCGLKEDVATRVERGVLRRSGVWRGRMKADRQHESMGRIYPISPLTVGNALVTPLELCVSMGGSDHLLTFDSHARLFFGNTIKRSAVRICLMHLFACVRGSSSHLSTEERLPTISLQIVGFEPWLVGGP